MPSALKPRTITLRPADCAVLLMYGRGNLSRGVRRAAAVLHAAVESTKPRPFLQVVVRRTSAGHGVFLDFHGESYQLATPVRPDDYPNLCLTAQNLAASLGAVYTPLPAQPAEPQPP